MTAIPPTPVEMRETADRMLTVSSHWLSTFMAISMHAHALDQILDEAFDAHTKWLEVILERTGRPMQ